MAGSAKGSESSSLTPMQAFALVGQAADSYITGLANQSAYDTKAAGQRIMAGGYLQSAEMMKLQEEAATIDAKAQANRRMEAYDNNAAINAAMSAAMGLSGENDTIDRANNYAAELDTSAIKRAGKMKKLQAQSNAASMRSSAKQAKIQAKLSEYQGSGAARRGTIGMVASLCMLAAMA